jgi:protein TonB
MNGITMDYNFQPKDKTGKYTGLAVVAGLHVLLGYALVSGLARKGFEVVKKPLEAVVIQEVILPPPPPPPPPPKKIEPPKIEAPKVEAPPPPPYVPPPEVTPPPSAAPAIVSIPTPPPEPVVIAPPPPPAPPAPPAAPAKADIGVVCPTQAKPEMPRKAAQEGTTGVVKAQATIRGGVVKEVQILSGPRVFHAAVRAAMMQYKCQSGDADVQAVQEFEFKTE